MTYIVFATNTTTKKIKLVDVNISEDEVTALAIEPPDVMKSFLQSPTLITEIKSWLTTIGITEPDEIPLAIWNLVKP